MSIANFSDAGTPHPFTNLNVNSVVSQSVTTPSLTATNANISSASITLGSTGSEATLVASAQTSPTQYTIYNAGSNSDVRLGIANTSIIPTISNVTSAMSGQILFASNTAGFPSYNMPSPQSGLYYKVIVNGSIAGATHVDFVFASNSLFGVIKSLNSATDTPISGMTQLHLESTSSIGDFYEFTSDGSKWFVSGIIAQQTAYQVS